MLTISEAASRMSRMDIRRLGVFYKGDLIGLVSSKDILGVMPELIEIIQERSKIDSAGRAEEESGAEEKPLSGYCDRCGTYSESSQGSKTASTFARTAVSKLRTKMKSSLSLFLSQIFFCFCLNNQINHFVTPSNHAGKMPHGC